MISIAHLILCMGLVGGVAAATESSVSTAPMLRCDGRSNSRGIDAPPDARISGPEEVGQTFVLERKQIRITSSGSADEVLALCSKTQTAMVFSDTCKLTPEMFLQAWRAVGTAQSTSPDLHVIFNRLEIDRVTLRVNWQHVLSVVRAEPGNVPSSRVYFVEDSFAGQCSRVKARI